MIQYYGKGYVKVALGEQVLSINPPSKGADVAGPRFGAAVVFSSVNLPAYNGIEIGRAHV